MTVLFQSDNDEFEIKYSIQFISVFGVGTGGKVAANISYYNYLNEIEYIYV